MSPPSNEQLALRTEDEEIVRTVELGELRFQELLTKLKKGKGPGRERAPLRSNSPSCRPPIHGARAPRRRRGQEPSPPGASSGAALCLKPAPQHQRALARRRRGR